VVVVRAVIIDRPDFGHKGAVFRLFLDGRTMKIESETRQGSFKAIITLTEEEAEEILEELDDTFPERPDA
jgi:hypothetical protein